MARVINPIGSAEVRGKVGAQQFSNCRAGQVVKVNSGPRKYDTLAQEHVRAHTKALTIEWQALSSSQRQTWNQWALEHPVIDRLGQVIHLSGYNWYCRANWIRNFGGRASHSVPIVNRPPQEPQNFAAAGGVGQCTLTWSDPPWLQATTTNIWFAKTGPVSKGKAGDITHAIYYNRRTFANHSYTPTGLLPGRYHWWAKTQIYEMSQTSNWVYAFCDVT